MAISGHAELARSLNLLKDAQVLAEEAERLLAYSAIVKSIEEQLVVNEETYRSFTTHLSRLRDSAQLLAPALEGIQTVEDEFTLGVKIPEQIDLDQLSRSIGILDSALNQALLNPNVEGTPRFIGFDRGSDWILIALGSRIAANLIKKMVDQYFTWRERLAEIAQKEETIRSLRLSNDAKEKVGDILTSALEEERSSYKRALDDELLKTANMPAKAHEEKKRILIARDLFWDLMERGIEMHLQLSDGTSKANEQKGAKLSGRERKSLPPASNSEAE